MSVKKIKDLIAQINAPNEIQLEEVDLVNEVTIFPLTVTVKISSSASVNILSKIYVTALVAVVSNTLFAVRLFILLFTARTAT